MKWRQRGFISGVLVLVMVLGVSMTASGNTKAMKKIGILQMTPVLDICVEAFKHRLHALGYREGETVQYVYRNAQGSLPKLRQYADELVAMRVDLLFTLTTPATAAAKAATNAQPIPIVFTAVMFPQEVGFVERIERPGGWITGTSPLVLATKQLEVLAQVIPSLRTLGVVYTDGDHSEVIEQLLQAIRARNLTVQTAPVRSAAEVADAVARLLPRIDALYIPADNIVTTQMATIIRTALQQQTPVMVPTESAVKEGALISYIADYPELAAFSAEMAHKILQGEKPAEVPVEYPVNPKLTLNLKTSRAIGLDVPTAVVFLADEVIE
jgi:putative ABC transport system substrate-binding protein